MNKLEEAILLELKKELKENTGNNMQQIILAAVEKELEKIKTSVAKLTPGANQTPAEMNKLDKIGDIIALSREDSFKEQLKDKINELFSDEAFNKIEQDMISYIGNSLERSKSSMDRLKLLRKNFQKGITAGLVAFNPENLPINWGLYEVYTSPGVGSVITGRTDLVEKEAFKNNKKAFLRYLLNMNIKKYSESKDKELISEFRKTLIKRLIFNIKTEELLTSFDYKEYRKYYNEKPTSTTFIDEFKKMIKNSLTIRYAKGTIGYELFSNKDELPPDFDNWIQAFEGWYEDNKGNVDYTPIARIINQSLFAEPDLDKPPTYENDEGTNKNPYLEKNELVKKDYQDLTKETIIKLINKVIGDNPKTEEEKTLALGGKGDVSQAIFNAQKLPFGFKAFKKFMRKQHWPVKLDGTSGEQMRLLKKAVIDSQSPGEWSLIVLSTFLFADLVDGDDSAIKKINELLYNKWKKPKLELDRKKAAKEKAKEQPEQWQQFMSSFQVAYSPAVARFKSTIGDMINELEKEIKIQSDPPANRDDLLEEDDADSDKETVINFKDLKEKQDELKLYQTFINEKIVPVLQALTIDEFKEALNNWNDDDTLKDQRGENIFKNKTVQDKQLIIFEDPIKISYGDGKYVPLEDKPLNENEEEKPPPTSIVTADKEIMQKASRTISGLVALQLRVIGQRVDKIKGNPLKKITADDVLKKMKEDDFNVDQNDIKVADRAKENLTFIDNALEYLKELFGLKKEVWKEVNWDNDEEADLAVKAFIQNGEKSGWDGVKRAILDANLDPEGLTKEGKRRLVKNLVQSNSKDYIKIDNDYFGDDRVTTSIIIEKTASNKFKKVIKKDIAKRIENAAKDADGFLQIYGIPLENISQETFDDFVDNVLYNVANPSGTTPLNLLTKIRDQVQTPEEIRREDLGTFEDIVAQSQKTRHDAGEFKAKSERYLETEPRRRGGPRGSLEEKLERTINNYINKRKQQWRKRTM